MSSGNVHLEETPIPRSFAEFDDAELSTSSTVVEDSSGDGDWRLGEHNAMP